MLQNGGISEALTCVIGVMRLLPTIGRHFILLSFKERGIIIPKQKQSDIKEHINDSCYISF